jgi:HlyD family secretion protein
MRRASPQGHCRAAELEEREPDVTGEQTGERTTDATSPTTMTPATAPGQENGDVEAARIRRTRLIRIGVGLGVLIAAVIGWRVLRAPDIPDSVVVLSGRIEGDDSAIASKTSGRILEVRFREGDHVDQGDVIATLDDAQIRAREAQAQAAVEQAQARVTAAERQIAVLNEQLVQNQLLTAQAGEDAAGRVRQAEGDLAAAESDLAQQEATRQLTEFDRVTYAQLAQEGEGAVSEREATEATSKAAAQASAVAAAKRRVDAAHGALRLARATLANPAIHTAQTGAVERQIAQQEAEVASAQFQLLQARAQLAEAQANRQDLTIRAPFAGSIITRAAEPGEVIAAGTALVTLLDLTKVYLRGFIPEGQIGKVALGRPARVFLDSAPNTPLRASVSRIDPQATFTPENTYFRNDRVKQVVGVKLQLQDGFGFAKPGMPADGEILVQGDTWPRRITRQ